MEETSTGPATILQFRQDIEGQFRRHIREALDVALAEEAFRTRPLSGDHPHLWGDATYHKVRVDGRVMSHATVVAVGVTAEGERQVLGLDVGPSEDRAFWTAFLRSLVKRGLRGVRLVISDAQVFHPAA